MTDLPLAMTIGPLKLSIVYIGRLEKHPLEIFSKKSIFCVCRYRLEINTCNTSTIQPPESR